MSTFASLLPTLVSSGAGILSGILGGKSPQQKASNSIAGEVPSLINSGNDATQSGLGQLGAAGHYYNTILGGNKDAISNLLNPQVGTVLGQYDSAAKEVARSAPRGGGATSTLAAIPFRKATAAGSAYQSALPGAAEGSARVGQAIAGVGTEQTRQALGYAPTGFDYDKLRAEQYSSLGSGLGKVLANLLQKKLGGTGGGGGGGSSSPGRAGSGGGGVDPGLLDGYSQNDEDYDPGGYGSGDQNTPTPVTSSTITYE